jgi:hypothetical protein
VLNIHGPAEARHWPERSLIKTSGEKEMQHCVVDDENCVSGHGDCMWRTQFARSGPRAAEATNESTSVIDYYDGWTIENV